MQAESSFGLAKQPRARKHHADDFLEGFKVYLLRDQPDHRACATVCRDRKSKPPTRKRCRLWPVVDSTNVGNQGRLPWRHLGSKQNLVPLR